MTEQPMDNYAMMVDCPEIQGQWEPKAGDRVWYKAASSPTMIRDREAAIWYKKHRDLHLWLPRQEDIQEMLANERKEFGLFGVGMLNMLTLFQSWVHESLPLYKSIWRYTSIDELWLAFYMHEEHNKTWEKGEWA